MVQFSHRTFETMKTAYWHHAMEQRSVIVPTLHEFLKVLACLPRRVSEAQSTRPVTSCRLPSGHGPGTIPGSPGLPHDEHPSQYLLGFFVIYLAHICFENYERHEGRLEALEWSSGKAVGTWKHGQGSHDDQSPLASTNSSSTGTSSSCKLLKPAAHFLLHLTGTNSLRMTI